MASKTSGQINERGKNKWLVRVDMGRDAEGKRQRYNKTVHGTKKEAQAVLNKLLRDKDMGLLSEAARMSFGSYLDHWLETAAQPRLRAKTFEEYSSQLKRYVRPELDRLKLEQVTPVAIQKLYTGMLNRKLSARTVRLTHAILRNALQQAVKWRMLPFNPADAVDLPKQERQEMRSLNQDEAQRFLEAVGGTRWDVLFTALLTTGLRPSEALALRWGDIDLGAGQLSVRRTVKRVKGAWVYEEPKTKSSRRLIELPMGTVRALAGLERDGELVFTNGLGEPVNIFAVIEHHFKPALKRVGLPKEVRLYDLRHTHATLLLLAGVHPKIVSERLGHSSIQITLDTYSHVLPTMQKETAAKLDAMLFSTPKKVAEIGLN